MSLEFLQNLATVRYRPLPSKGTARNIERAGRDEEGRQVVRADKIDITIENIIAHNGRGEPSFEDAHKDFSTAFVAVVLPGQTPSPELIERTDGIRREWMGHWSKVTGGVATLNTSLVGR